MYQSRLREYFCRKYFCPPPLFGSDSRNFSVAKILQRTVYPHTPDNTNAMTIISSSSIITIIIIIVIIIIIITIIFIIIIIIIHS